MSEQPVIVIDHGSQFTKVGYNDDTYPRTIFPTLYAFENGLGYHMYVGKYALQYKQKRDKMKWTGGTDVTYPIKNGIIKDWHAMVCFKSITES